MPAKDEKKRTPWWRRRLRRLLPPLVLLVGMGCVSVKLNNAERLIDKHPQGFSDAVNASPESRAFVEDALKTINALEETIEAR